MKWPWTKKRKLLDPHTQHRIDKLQQRVEEQGFLSDQAVTASQELTERTGETRERAVAMRVRNHFGEAIDAIYAAPPKEWRLPWRR